MPLTDGTLSSIAQMTTSTPIRDRSFPLMITWVGAICGQRVRGIREAQPSCEAGTSSAAVHHVYWNPHPRAVNSTER
jgi:hypothetical protein